MIKFNELRIKNFLSYGNSWTVFKFNVGVTRISGINGCGKSSIVDGIYFAIFGKPYRKIPLGKVINAVNKTNLKVELDFQDDDYDYKICRGSNPNYFEIYKNGELIDQSSTKRGYQNFLEEDVFHFNENIFQEIGIKSLTRYGSFLTLTKSQKRAVIEKIFDLEIISKMKEINKDFLNEKRSEINSLKKDESKYKMLIDQEEENIKKLLIIKEQLQTDIDKENEEKDNDIKEYKNEIKKLKKGLQIIKQRQLYLDQLNIEKSKQNNILKKLGISKNKIEREMTIHSSKIQMLEDVCPTCPNISNIISNSDIIIQQEKLKKISNDEKEIEEKLENLRIDIFKLEKIVSNKDNIESKIDLFNSNILKLEKSKKVKTTDVKIDETNLKKYKKELKIIQKNISEINNDLYYYEIVESILKDEGIKSFIISKYLPLLNKMINTYLQKFGINLELEFTNNLDINILTKFKENFNYENFSEGEKKRIDLAVLFTFIEFVKLKYSNAKMNIMILDEFSSGLDSEGENILYEILKEISINDESEIITISHSKMIDPEKIDRRFEVSMKRGFSQLEEITI